MKTYTVRTLFRNFDAKLSKVRFFSKLHDIRADSAEEAMAIAWQYVLDEYPYCHLASQTATYQGKLVAQW